MLIEDIVKYNTTFENFLYYDLMNLSKLVWIEHGP